MSATLELHDHSEEEDLPAWSLPAEAVERIRVPVTLPEQVTREWAWGGSTGAGVRVCILDSGIELDHPLVGRVDHSVAVVRNEEGELEVRRGPRGRPVRPRHGLRGDRALARARRRAHERPRPRRGLHRRRRDAAARARVGDRAGVRGHEHEPFDDPKRKYVERLHELADHAYFKRGLLVASAHNMPVESFPWRFASVISVGSHEESDPLTFYYNPSPPVEFFARGLDLDVAWLGGGTLRCTGNSFATPHIAGICALILGKHPDLTPFQLKSVLHLTASNAAGAAA